MFGKQISPNHVIGMCSKCNNDAIVWIPKNGSTSIRDYFSETIYSYYAWEVDTYHVILRDPYTRWISGVCEYIKKYNAELDLIIEDIDKGRLIFAEFTTPQVNFLDFNGDTIFYNLEDNAINKIFDYFNIDANIPWRKKSSTNAYRSKLKKKLLKRLKTRKIYKKIYDFYAQDYELVRKNLGISTVKFFCSKVNY
jgi:hypothetical protein